jgi:hypothetical protein
MSNYDSEGTRVVIAACETKKHLFAFFHAVTHFLEGLVELKSAPITKNAYQNIINEYIKGTHKPFVLAGISAKYATYLMEEGAKASGKYLQEIEQVRQFVSHVKDEVEIPADIYRLQLPDTVNALSLDRVLSNGILTPFILSWDTIDNDRKEFNSVGTSSSIVLPPYMVEEKKQAFIRVLIEHEQVKQNLMRTRRLLEDYAYIFYCLHELSSYKSLIETIKNPVTEKEMFTRFVRNSLEKTDQQPQPGLIINPYEQVRR